MLNLLTYTTQNLAGQASVDSSTKITMLNFDKNAERWIWFDWGVAFLSTAAGFTHRFKVNISAVSAGAGCDWWRFANVLDDILDIVGSGQDCIAINQAGGVNFVQVAEVTGGAFSAASDSISLNTDYYAVIDMIAGALRMRLYTDEAETVEAYNESMVLSQAYLFRYHHALASVDQGNATRRVSGTIENYNFGPFGAQRTRSKFTSPLGRKRSSSATGSMMPKMPGAKRGFK